ncbi:MAG: alpha/beta hydrolase [Kangiellaceae bacterium]|nr:alpha/beta hydrolase [Kangiellaceae bacterium]
MIEYKIPLGGCECSIAEWNPDAEIIVFALHGWLDNLATFETLAAKLPEIRLIAFDFPGHGHSAHIGEGQSYHFLDGLYFIDDLIEFFQVEKAILLGHSMGGAISTVYASIQPKRVEKLILIEALGPITSPAEVATNTLLKALTQRRALKDKRKPIYETFALALSARASVSEIEPNLIKPLVERALTSVEGGYTWRADSRLRMPSALRMSEEQLCSMLPNIQAPCLLIEAKFGYLRMEEAKHIQERKQFVFNLEECLLEGGHHLHLEYPDLVADKIKQFLNLD